MRGLFPHSMSNTRAMRKKRAYDPLAQKEAYEEVFLAFDREGGFV